MSIRVLRSPASKPNRRVTELVRKTGEDNLIWIRRALEAALPKNLKNYSLLLLVGGKDPMSFRLRIAQAHVRHDLSPSAWSHVLLLAAVEKSLGSSETIEVSLMPSGGFGPLGYPLPKNGIQSGHLGDYRSEKVFPNIALLAIPVEVSSIVSTLSGMKYQRSSLDCSQLILKWLGYCWGVGVPASPLGDGFGIPSAAVIEAAFSANGFDLTPGLESRSSCPEAIWQAASWWQDYYEKQSGGKVIHAAFSAKHDLVPDDYYGFSVWSKGNAEGEKKSSK